MLGIEQLLFHFESGYWDQQAYHSHKFKDV